MGSGSWQVEMLWRCTSCKHRNRGRDLVCGGCGNPKDGSEDYEMPDDVSRANAVDDPSLLRMAHAGANWRCAFCGSDVRRLDGACGRCGAAEARAEPAQRMATPKRSAARSPSLVLALGAAAVGVLCLGGIVCAARRPRAPYAPPPVAQVPSEPAFVDVEGEVVSTKFAHTVTVERHQLWDFEGFAEAKPQDARDVRTLPPRVHHHVSVLDGYDTKTWTEKVQDGYDTKSYTVSEACGQTCTPKPKTCRNVCKSKKNGFATCNNVCTGGGMSCSTKYCTVTKTKQVPRYKDVTKSKQVPRYRKDPVMAPWYAWKALAWRAVRSVTASAVDEPPRWPSAQEIALGKDEREVRTASYTITLAYAADAGPKLETTHSPPDLAAFLAMPKGSKHAVRVFRYGAVEVTPRPVPVASASASASASP